MNPHPPPFAAPHCPPRVGAAGGNRLTIHYAEGATGWTATCAACGHVAEWLDEAIPPRWSAWTAPTRMLGVPPFPDAGDVDDNAAMLEQLEGAIAIGTGQLEDLEQMRGELLAAEAPGREASAPAAVVRRLVELVRASTMHGLDSLRIAIGERRRQLLEDARPGPFSAEARDTLRARLGAPPMQAPFAFDAGTGRMVPATPPGAVLPELQCSTCERAPTPLERARIARDRLQHGIPRKQIAFWTCDTCRPAAGPTTVRVNEPPTVKRKPRR